MLSVICLRIHSIGRLLLGFHPLEGDGTNISIYYLDGNAGGPGLRASLNIQTIIIWK